MMMFFSSKKAMASPRVVIKEVFREVIKEVIVEVPAPKPPSKEKVIQAGLPGYHTTVMVATQTPRPKENDYKNVKSKLHEGTASTLAKLKISTEQGIISLLHTITQKNVQFVF